MSEPIICAVCGLPIEPGRGYYDDSGAYHLDVDVCFAALKSALASASADRDRYRGVLVALRDAERAYAKAQSARNAAYRASRGCATTEFVAAARVCDAAGDAESDALDAAIAAVEEDGE